MGNLFEGKKVYGAKWSGKCERNLTGEEKSMVASVEVVDSDYGLSACFVMSSGGSVYIPMSKDANVVVGEVLDVNKCKVLTLCRPGDQDIERIVY